MKSYIFRAIPTLSLLESRDGPSSLTSEVPLSESISHVSASIAGSAVASAGYGNTEIPVSQLNNRQVSEPLIVIQLPANLQPGNPTAQLSISLPKEANSPLTSSPSDFDSLLAGVTVESPTISGIGNSSSNPASSGRSGSKALHDSTQTQVFLPPVVHLPVRVPVG